MTGLFGIILSWSADVELRSRTLRASAPAAATRPGYRDPASTDRPSQCCTPAIQSRVVSVAPPAVERSLALLWRHRCLGLSKVAASHTIGIDGEKKCATYLEMYNETQSF